jgi:hypothetical protein
MTKKFTNADETQELQPYAQNGGKQTVERTSHGDAFRSRPLWRHKYPDGSCRPLLTNEAAQLLAAERRGDDAHHAAAG